MALSALNFQERLEWEFFNRSPCVWLHLAKFCNLFDASEVAVATSVQRPQQVFEMHPQVVENLLALPVVRDFCMQNGVELQTLRKASSVQIWYPLAFLMPQGQWQVVVLGGRNSLNRLPKSLPAPVRAAWTRAGQLFNGIFAQQSSDMSDPVRLRHWADRVREWAELILSNQRCDPEQERMSFEAAVSMFEAHADSLDQLHMQPWLESFGRHGSQKRYRMMQLLRLVLVAQEIRNVSKTRQVVQSVLRAALPAAALPQFEEALEDNNIGIPGPSVLRNMRFVVDCSLMLFFRKHLREVLEKAPVGDQMLPAAVYLLADSSPQGGRNLLNSEYDYIAAIHLLPLAKSFFRLQKVVANIHDVEAATALAGQASASSNDFAAGAYTLQEYLQEEEDLLGSCSELVRHHSNIPVCLGSLEAQTFQEFVALQHAVLMEVGSSTTLALWNESVVSITTDRGTEKGFVNVAGVDFATAFPHFLSNMPLRDFQADDGAGEGPNPDVMQALAIADDNGDIGLVSFEPGASLTLESALDVAGVQHALSNASKALLVAMPHYESDFWPLLNALSQWITKPWQRERFCQKCLTGVLEPLRDLFQVFPWSLVKWRWLTLSALVPELLVRERALRDGWSLASMSGNFHERPDNDGGAVGEDQAAEGDHGPEAAVQWILVDQAINSSAFWAWLKMLHIITAILGFLEAWFFDCPCHSQEITVAVLLRVVSVSMGSLRHESGGRKSKDKCPFRRRRAAELASGDFLRMVDRLLSLSSEEVLLSVVPACGPESQAKIIQDFEAARAHLRFHLHVQFASWTSLPRVLAGMFHPLENQARNCAATALRQWEAYTPEQRQNAHSLSKLFCSRHDAGNLRRQVCEFIAGVSLTDDALADLLFHVARLGMIPLSEITVEGMHAKIHARLKKAPRAGMPTLSLESRWMEFLHALQQPQAFDWFSRVCSKIYHPRSVSHRCF